MIFWGGGGGWSVGLSVRRRCCVLVHLRQRVKADHLNKQIFSLNFVISYDRLAVVCFVFFVNVVMGERVDDGNCGSNLKQQPCVRSSAFDMTATSHIAVAILGGRTVGY